MKSVTWKFPGRRNAEDFVIYPAQGDDVIIQSSKSIAIINMRTGQGKLNVKGSGSKYFPHLNEFLGAKQYKFPKELLMKIQGNTPKSGDEIAPGFYYG